LLQVLGDIEMAQGMKTTKEKVKKEEVSAQHTNKTQK